jgi:hypothetical protein
MSSKEVGNCDKESKEDDYDHQELEQKQEEVDSGEITTTMTTTNHFF